MQSMPPASWGELLSGSNALRSVALAGGVGLHAVNVYVVTTILPTAVHEIGGLRYYAWNTTLFVMASIVGSVLSTKLIQVAGARGAYLIALAIFCLGTLGCAVAPSMPWMLASRSVQGVGGGFLLSICYALIRLIFEPRLWSRAMGLVSGMWGVATLCGPTIGGVFAQSGHWRWAFWSLFPAAGVLATIVCRQLAPKPAEIGETGEADEIAESAVASLPLRQLLLLVASVLVVSLASLSKEPIWSGAGVLLGLGLGVLMAKIDRHAQHRLLPSGAYSLAHPLGRIYAVMALLVVGMSTEIFVSYFLQTIHGKTPLAAGYLTAVMAAGWTAASLTSAGRTGDAARRMLRRGPVIVFGSLVGLAIATPRIGWLSGASEAIGTAGYAVLLGGVGFGIGLGWPHLLLRVLGSAKPGEETLASASITTVQLYTTAVAASLAGVVANSAGFSEPGGVVGAQSASIWLYGLFAFGPAVAALLVRKVK